MYRPSHRVVLAAILAIGLGLRLWHAAVIRETGIAEIPKYYDDSDLNANLRWAETIISGDLLGRETYHPYPGWMREIAPLEQWHVWWGGRSIFQQAPLYPYLLAALWHITGVSLWGAVLVQLLVGALQPLICYALTARLMGRSAGLVAAGLAAVYAPGIALQGILLRDWLPAILDPLALLLLLRGVDSGRRRDLALAGIALGLSILAKETSVLLLAMALVWIWLTRKREHRPFAGTVVTVAAAALITVSPLIIRNLIVGAPPLALSNRTAEALIAGNAVNGFPVGVYFPPSTGTILERSNGRTGPLVKEILAGYEGRWDRLAANFGLKARGMIDPFEIPDNVSFDFLRETSPALRILDWGILVPLGLAGLVLVWPFWRRRGLLLGYAALATAGILATLVIGRYRLPLALPLIVCAAGGLSRIPHLVSHGQWRRIAAGGAVLVLVAACQHLLIPIPELRSEPRWALASAEHAMLGIHWAEEGDYRRAINQMDILSRKASGPPAMPDVVRRAANARAIWQLELAKQLLDEGNTAEARRLAEQAGLNEERQENPTSRSFELGRIYRRLGETDLSERWLTRYLDAEPEGEFATEARELLSGS